MNVKQLLRDLKPAGYGDSLEPEPFVEWRARAMVLLPSWPDDALEQWLYRHYTNAVTDYGWLGLPSVSWRREKWTTKALLTDVGQYENHGLVEAWSHQLRAETHFQGTWLGRNMIEKGTWPIPVMLIRNEIDLRRPDGLALGKPFHLMEGHHRLGYLSALASDARWSVASDHEVLIAQPDPSAVLNYWPLNNDM